MPRGHPWPSERRWIALVYLLVLAVNEKKGKSRLVNDNTTTIACTLRNYSEKNTHHSHCIFPQFFIKVFFKQNEMM